MHPARPSVPVILGFSLLLALFSLASIHASPQLPTGKQQFVSRCAACHGEDGHGGQLGPNIVDVVNPRATSVDAVRRLIRSGIPSAGMPAFTSLPDAEVDAIATYVMSLKASAATQAPTT
jgi:cytochrome c oxidase cbb3-type subunit III